MPYSTGFKDMVLERFRVGCRIQGLGYKIQGLGFRRWEFPKIRGTIFVSPYNKDPTIF